MNENLNVNEVEEVIVEEQEKESKIKVVANKAGRVAKKHGKKILAGVGVGLLSAIAYGLGKRSMMEDDVIYLSDDEFVVLDEAEEDVIEDDAE